MSWTVPSGCYYAVYAEITSTTQGWVYYNAGSSVPNGRAPQDHTSSQTATSGGFVLVDFTNGYIYRGIKVFALAGGTNQITVTINNNNTFSASSASGILLVDYNVRVLASARSCEEADVVLKGATFNFGNGSGLLNKNAFLNNAYTYKMDSTFYGRTDITSVTIPNGVTSIKSAFNGCTNLQIVTGTLSYIESAESAFEGCKALTTLPTFPATSNASFKNCFRVCHSLVTPPTIPSGVTDMQHCFEQCLELATAPTIPSSVTNMQSCFWYCGSLAGAVTINTSLPSQAQVADMFTGTTNEIVLLGSSSMLDTIASDYNNVYVWSLSNTMTAQRNNTTSTTVNVSVDVSRFNDGNLSSLNLYRDTSTTPLSVTWNDPTLEIDGTPTTFTTSLTNIGESDTFTLKAVATDQYGSANAVTVKIPIAFYTMDVQAGGKEIAFGAIADDDLTNYPDGLFRCNMNFVDVKLVGEIKAYAGVTVPNGWLECDGSELAIADYPLLYNAIGNLWGAPSDADHFVLPDLKGRVPVGQDTADTDFDTIGDDGGSKYIQQHSHSSSFTRPTISSGGGWSFAVTALGARSGSTSLASGWSNTTSGKSSQTRYKISNNNNTASGGTSMQDLITHSGHAHGSTGGSVSVGNINTSGLSTGSAGNLQPYAVVKYIICAV